MAKAAKDSHDFTLSATLVIVMVTVVICGGSTVSLLTFFDIPLGVEDDEDKSPLSSSATPNHNYSSMSETQVPAGSTPADKSMAAQAWSGFDSKYMKPLLTHSNPTLMETLPDCCSGMARALTSTQQLARHPQMAANGISSPVEEEPAVFNQVESNDEIITVHTQEPDEKRNEDLKQRFPSDL